MGWRIELDCDRVSIGEVHSHESLPISFVSELK